MARRSSDYSIVTTQRKHTYDVTQSERASAGSLLRAYISLASQSYASACRANFMIESAARSGERVNLCHVFNILLYHEHVLALSPYCALLPLNLFTLPVPLLDLHTHTHASKCCIHRRSHQTSYDSRFTIAVKYMQAHCSQCMCIAYSREGKKKLKSFLI